MQNDCGKKIIRVHQYLNELVEEESKREHGIAFETYPFLSHSFHGFYQIIYNSKSKRKDAYKILTGKICNRSS